MICLGHARISFRCCLLLPSFFLPPTTKFFQTHNDHNENHLQAGGSVVAAIIGWESSPRYVSFFIIYSFTNFHYSYTTLPVAATEVDEDTTTQQHNESTRTREVDRTRRINESTGTRQMVNPPQGFFFYSLLNFCISYNDYLDDHDHDRQRSNTNTTNTPRAADIFSTFT